MTFTNQNISGIKNLPKTLSIQPYLDQSRNWPTNGRHLLAHFDDEAVTVYQAYNPKIASYAVKHQKFGGEGFKFGRMTWIKPSFLWMNYRSGWNTKPNQERTLAIRITHEAFCRIVTEAVESTYDPNSYKSRADWEKRKNDGEVRVQWDPDYTPSLQPEKLERRAIQLGVRGKTMETFATKWIVSIEDITDFVVEMRVRLEQAENKKDFSSIWIPKQTIYHLPGTTT